MQKLCTEDHKTLFKEMNEDLNEWKKISHIHGSEDNIVKMMKLSKLIYWFNIISIKIFLFSRSWQGDPKTVGNLKGFRTAETILKRKKWKDSHFLILKLITKVQWSRQSGTGKKINMDQWNRIKTPEINSYICSELIFVKDVKTT